MPNLPDNVTCFDSVYARDSMSNTIASSATTANPHLFTTGDIECAGDSYVDGDEAVTGDLAVATDLTVGGTMAVTGAGSVGGAFSVEGALNIGTSYSLDITSVATAGVYTVLATDCVIAVDTDALSAAVTIHVPAAIAAAGKVLYVIDEGGHAASTGINIEIASGSLAPSTISTASLGIMYISDGTNYVGFKSIA